MSDRDDPTTPSKRMVRRPPSFPKLEALGWDKDDPTEIMRKSLAKLEGSNEGARVALAEQVSDARASTKSAIANANAKTKRAAGVGRS